MKIELENFQKRKYRAKQVWLNEKSLGKNINQKHTSNLERTVSKAVSIFAKKGNIDAGDVALISFLC